MTNVRFASLASLILILTPATLHGQSCENLGKHAAPSGTVVTAKMVDGGSFTPDGGGGTVSHLPVFCRIAAILRPTSDSVIGVEVWLPSQASWNGKFLAVGSGGWGGTIAYSPMADALRRGYATSATDDGHSGASGRFILGHPQKLIDFAYRAEHEMTVEAKSLIRAFYGRGPRYSYWDGCSGGGREGMLQAYRYPDAFDGVIAGDPADIRRNAWALWLANKTFKDPASFIPEEKYPMIHRAVLDACDAVDGVKDGLIENPESCPVSLKALACKASDSVDCLTPRQIQTAETIMSPATDSTGKVYFPRLEPGTELRWGRLAGGPEPADLFLDQFRYVVYQNPEWDWRSFDLARDAAKEDAVDRGVDELEPQLSAFRKRGGKLLIYHGWADQQVAPGSSVEFYHAIVKQSGEAEHSSEWVRLFMVPGMAHCSGGEGPDTFDKIKVMEEWVEQGRAPAQILATHRTAGRVDRTRPLCPYPQMARYQGTGSIDEASSFSCRSR